MEKMSNYEYMNLYLDNAFDVSYINNNGENILFFCKSHHRKEFIEKGADVNLRNKEGKSLLHYPLSKAEFIELLSAGFMFKEGEDYSQLDYAQTRKLVELISLEELKKIKINTKIENSGSGNTLISNLDDYEKVEYLVSQGVNINKRNQNGDVYFMAPKNIAEKTAKKIKLLLLKSGIDVNNINNAGRTLLHYEKDVEILKLILGKCNVINQKCNTYGRTCLFYSSPEKMKILIEYGVDLNVKGKNGRLAFHDVLDEDIKLYMIDKGLDPNYKDNKGKNLLFHPLINKKVIEALINSGVDINLKDNEGLNALFYQNEENIKELINNGILFDCKIKDTVPREKIMFIESEIIKRDACINTSKESSVNIKRL